MRVATIILSFILLVSCGTTRYWTKEGADAEQVARDLALCEYEAAKVTATCGSSTVIGGTPIGGSGGGFLGGFAAGLASAARQAQVIEHCNDKRVVRACMKVLGYERSEIPPQGL